MQQLAATHPTGFEFTAAFLLWIRRQMHACFFGTFLFDSDRARVADAPDWAGTDNFWAAAAVLPCADLLAAGLLNPAFDPRAPLLAAVREGVPRIWAACFYPDTALGGQAGTAEACRVLGERLQACGRLLHRSGATAPPGVNLPEFALPGSTLGGGGAAFAEVV